MSNETLDRILDKQASPERGAVDPVSRARDAFRTIITEMLPKHADTVIMPGDILPSGLVADRHDRLAVDNNGNLVRLGENCAAEPASNLDVINYGPDLMQEFCRQLVKSMEWYAVPSELEQSINIFSSTQLKTYFDSLAEADNFVHCRGNLGIDPGKVDEDTLDRLEKIKLTLDLNTASDEISKRIIQYADNLDRVGLAEFFKVLVSEYICRLGLMPHPRMTRQTDLETIYPSRAMNLMDRYRSLANHTLHWCVSEQGELDLYNNDGHAQFIRDIDSVFLQEAPVIMQQFIKDTISYNLPNLEQK